MSLTRRFITAFAVTASLALAACGGNGGPSGRAATVQDGEFAIGDENASVTLIEYASVACGACRQFHEEVWPMLDSEFIETGRVRFVMREMLTGSRDIAVAGFMLARCVPQERYFDAIDVLFKEQIAIFNAARQPNGARERFLLIASNFGINEAGFDECMGDVETLREINALNRQALEDGISGTPAFLVNGELLDSRPAAGADTDVYYLGDRPVRIDGELVPAIVDEETFRRLLEHFVTEADAAQAG